MVSLSGCSLFDSLDKVALRDAGDSAGDADNRDQTTTDTTPDSGFDLWPDLDANFFDDIGGDTGVDFPPSFSATVVMRDVTNLDTGDVAIVRFLKTGMRANVTIVDDDLAPPASLGDVVVITDTVDQAKVNGYRDIDRPRVICDAATAQNFGLANDFMVETCTDALVADHPTTALVPNGVQRMLGMDALTCRTFSTNAGIEPVLTHTTSGRAIAYYVPALTLNTVDDTVVIGYANDRYVDTTHEFWRIFYQSVLYVANEGPPPNGRTAAVVGNFQRNELASYWALQSSVFEARARSLGFDVTAIDNDDVVSSDGALNDLLIIPRVGAIMTAGNAVRSAGAGIVTWSENAEYLREIGFADIQQNLPPTSPETAWFLLANPFNDIVGAFAVMDRPSPMTPVPDFQIPGGSDHVAHVPGDASSVFAFTIDRGINLTNGDIAQGRRAYFGVGQGGIFLTDEGGELLDAMLWWASEP